MTDKLSTTPAGADLGPFAHATPAHALEPVKVDDGPWLPGRLGADRGRFARRLWTLGLSLGGGRHTLALRARDAAGDAQPLDPTPNQDGYPNNGVHRIWVEARTSARPAPPG